FVLAPAAEVAPKMLHPIIGWSVERLLLHLNSASDLLAIVSPSDESRARLAEVIQQRTSATAVPAPEFPTAEHHWPSAWTTWLALRPTPSDTKSEENKPALPYAAAAFPKLTILLDEPFAKPADKLQWSTLVRQPGRGPTLR